MGLPSKKRPKSEKRKRRAAKKMKKINLSPCPRCQKPVLPHHLCFFCGTYQNREVMPKRIKQQPSQKKKE
ncbi:MAG: 50S ribosomal protein L32 [Patescibacteria group bacterium]|nr:50S ribosomal protein L32 [Patescibacteria group bacterium]